MDSTDMRQRTMPPINDTASAPVLPAPSKPRRLVHPSIKQTQMRVDTGPRIDELHAVRGEKTAPSYSRRRGATAPLLPTTVQDAAAAAAVSTSGQSASSASSTRSTSRVRFFSGIQDDDSDDEPLLPLAKPSVLEMPIAATNVATPAEIWLVCAFTMEIPNTYGCTGNTINGCLKWMKAKYSHVEVLFRFNDNQWQVMKTNMANGTLILDAETAHYRNERVWKCFRFQLSAEEKRQFYARALAYKGAPFNLAALALYAPACFCLLRYMCCCFNCCLGVSFDEGSGRYYCTQIVLMIMKQLRPQKYGDLDSTQIVPDILVRLFLDDGLILSQPFPRENSRVTLGSEAV